MLKFKLKPMSYDVELAIVQTNTGNISESNPGMIDIMGQMELYKKNIDVIWHKKKRSMFY